MSNLPPAVELTKAVVEIVQGVMTTLAIIVGAIWAYFKVLKGRVYTRRLEPSLEGTIVSGTGHKLLVVRLAIKNVGLTRVNLDGDRSTLEVRAYRPADYIAEFHNAFTQRLGVVQAVRSHGWIEPGECINENHLLALPNDDLLGVVVRLSLLEDRKRQSPKDAIVWNAVAIITPGEIAQSTASSRTGPPGGAPVVIQSEDRS